jgi:hypothetical protein
MPVSLDQISMLDFENADAVASGFADLSWRQAPAYGEQAARRVGAAQERLSLRDETSLLGYADVRIKHLPATPWGVALVSQGPVVGASTPEHYGKALDLLADEYVRRRRLVLRVEPPLFVGDQSDVTRLFLERGFAHRPGEYHSFLIDLRLPTDDLRRKLDGKWRTDLARGERNAITIRCSEDPADFDRFAPLLDQLQAAKGFRAAQDVGFFRNIAARQRMADHIRIHLAEHEGKVIAGHVGAFSGDTAVYLLGATDAVGRQMRAAYLLQWAAICYAKQRGQRWYDLGGIDEMENPDVFRFKKRMGGDRIAAPRRFDLSPGRLAGWAIAAAERGRELAAKLRARA